MQLKPFKELIAMSKEKLDEAMAPIRARQVKAAAEMEKTKIETDIVNLETKVQELCTKKEVCFPALMDTLDELALLERRKQQYDEVLGQLFPESVTA